MSNSSSNPDSIVGILSFCFKTVSAKYHLSAFLLVSVPLILPLCLYILRLGVRQWRSRAKISHTDFFTYNMMFISLTGVVGSCLLAISLVLQSGVVIRICVFGFLVNLSAIVCFQVFTCVERYMAVLHPVAYLGMKSQTWSLIRSLSCLFVWLQCTLQTVMFSQIKGVTEYICVSLTCLSACVLVVLFCNLSVLQALIRPAPGDGAKGNLSKRKAFYTITAITGALLLMYGGDAIGVASFLFMEASDASCAFWFSLTWFSLPSSLVLPMLYLHRNGKLPALKQICNFKLGRNANSCE